MKIKLTELLKENPGESFLANKTYIMWEEDVKGYVDTVYLGEEHFASTNMIVFKHTDGKLYGVEDWVNSEGENGFTEEYNADPMAEVEIKPVKKVKVESYKYE